MNKKKFVAGITIIITALSLSFVLFASPNEDQEKNAAKLKSIKEDIKNESIIAKAMTNEEQKYIKEKEIKEKELEAEKIAIKLGDEDHYKKKYENKLHALEAVIADEINHLDNEKKNKTFSDTQSLKFKELIDKKIEILNDKKAKKGTASYKQLCEELDCGITEANETYAKSIGGKAYD